jgi:antitoxin (DNA-binding transcriptional repressor) of toxin-antitoxin stability system
MNLISATYARNNFSRLLDEVIEKGKRFILVRDSQPQAAIIPYVEIAEKEKEWQREFQRLITETRPYFTRWLEKRKMKKASLSEEKVYEIANKAAGRS